MTSYLPILKFRIQFISVLIIEKRSDKLRGCVIFKALHFWTRKLVSPLFCFSCETRAHRAGLHLRESRQGGHLQIGRGHGRQVEDQMSTI